MQDKKYTSSALLCYLFATIYEMGDDDRSPSFEKMLGCALGIEPPMYVECL